MGEWLSSREFAIKYDINYETLRKSCFRSNASGKKICEIGCNLIHFKISRGKGRGGKVLQIYSQPFETEQEAQAFLNHQANKAQARILQAALGETASPLTSLSATTQPTGETASPLNAFESHLSAPSPLNATAQQTAAPTALQTSISTYKESTNEHYINEFNNNSLRDYSDNLYDKCNDIVQFNFRQEIP